MGQKTYYTQLRLAPLGKEEAEELLMTLLWLWVTMHRASHALKQLILEKTEGTPFFMEEVVQTLAEEGVLSGERGSTDWRERRATPYLPHRARGAGGPHRPPRRQTRKPSCSNWPSLGASSR